MLSWPRSSLQKSIAINFAPMPNAAYDQLLRFCIREKKHAVVADADAKTIAVFLVFCSRMETDFFPAPESPWKSEPASADAARQVPCAHRGRCQSASSHLDAEFFQSLTERLAGLMTAGFHHKRVGDVGGNIFIFQHPFQHGLALARLQRLERGDKNFRRGFNGTHKQTIAINGAGFKRRVRQMIWKVRLR